MSRLQFIIVNILAGVFVTLMVAQYLLSQVNQQLNQDVITMQQQVAGSQQAKPVLNQLAIRLAQAAQKEPDMNDLLAKYRLKVTLPQTGTSAPQSGQVFN
ncbi:MAG: hypothetical protein AAGA18_01730 [Verrucomicrobiota bacterium]